VKNERRHLCGHPPKLENVNMEVGRDEVRLFMLKT